MILYLPQIKPPFKNFSSELFMKILTSPFTPEQIESFNACQISGVLHPFTCTTDDCKIRLLEASETHLFCPGCNYTQTWGWALMFDYSWKKFEYSFIKDWP